jgi:phage gpG-like protein
LTPQEFAEEFSAAAVRAGSLKPVLQDFADHMKLSIKDNFKAQGRPVAWKPVPNHPGHRAILVDTGALVDSTDAFVEGDTDVAIVAGGGGQNPGKAPSHQYGAKLHMRRYRSTGQFATKRSRKNVSDVPKGGLIGYGELPARPYLIFQDEDLRYLGTMLPSFIFKRGSGGWQQLL